MGAKPKRAASRTQPPSGGPPIDGDNWPSIDGDKLRRRREKLGLSRPDLAERTKKVLAAHPDEIVVYVSEFNIEKYERGKTKTLERKRLRSLALALDVAEIDLQPDDDKTLQIQINEEDGEGECDESPIPERIRTPPGQVLSVHFGDNGKRLLVAEGNEATIWEIEQPAPRQLCRFSDHPGQITCGVISPNGESVVTAGRRQAFSRWLDAKSGTIRNRLEGAIGWPSCVTFSPDSLSIAIVSEDRLRLWRSKEAPETHNHFQMDSRLTCGAMSSQPATLFLGRTDATVWRMTLAGKRTSVLHAVHSDAVSAIACNADGSLLVIGGEDGCVRAIARHGTVMMWRTRGAITCLAISPDALHVLSGDRSGSVNLWSINSRNPIDTWAHNKFVSALAIGGCEGLQTISAASDLIDVRVRNRIHL